MRWAKACVAVTGLFLMSVTAEAAMLAGWTFETNTPPSPAVSGATGPSITAEVGSGSISGVHADASSQWSTAAGYGSDNSFQATRWGTTEDQTGNYWQFSTSSLNYQDIMVSFQAGSSNFGPRDFKLQYSTDGSAFIDVSGGSYAVPAYGSTWDPGTSSAFVFSFDLSAITALNNDASIYFRLVQTSNVSANGSTVTTGGNSRLDNVIISGTLIPEPATLGLLGAGLLCLVRRRAARTPRL
jgi:hypothetical protein